MENKIASWRNLRVSACTDFGAIKKITHRVIFSDGYLGNTNINSL